MDKEPIIFYDDKLRAKLEKILIFQNYKIDLI